MPGSADDWGYNYQIDRGRLALASHFRKEIRTILRPNIPTSGAVGGVLRQLCDDGADLIFVADPQYQQQALAVARKYPEVTFMQFFTSITRSNLGSYAYRDWEPTYACGVAAAMTARDKTRFGFVGPLPVAPAKFTVNAFTLGVRSVTPTATVNLVYTGSWYDPDAECAAVERLTRRGVAAIYVFAVSPIVAVQTAEDQGVHVLAHFSDLSSLAPSQWVTGTTWNWQTVFIEVTERVLEDRWESRRYGGGFREGYATIAPFGPAVDFESQTQTRQAIKDIASGGLEVFGGPVRDNKGVLRVMAGESLPVAEIVTMDWLVEGVREDY